MRTPINNFQGILDAMERNPAFRDALRWHILTEELLQTPACLERMEGDEESFERGFSAGFGRALAFLPTGRWPWYWHEGAGGLGQALEIWPESPVRGDIFRQ